ncbi:hypothetical protein FRC04_012196 [Tulasnella sp. 424]|nr:hypothetical protein FRC04_012196 [Tulasnella sp. 424]
MDPAFANVLKQMFGGFPPRPGPLASQCDPVSPSPQPTPAGKKSRGGAGIDRLGSSCVLLPAHSMLSGDRDLPPRKIMAEMDVQTDATPEEMEIPILPVLGPVAADVELRSMVNSHEELETPRILSMASVRTARPVDMIFEDAEPETGTDGAFVDARESVAYMTPTPADSLSDFHIFSWHRHPNAIDPHGSFGNSIFVP